MLIKLVVDYEGLEVPVCEYVSFPEDSDNILKITKRKLAAIAREWRTRTADMTDPDDILTVFYDILDERDIAWDEAGPDCVIKW